MSGTKGVGKGSPSERVQPISPGSPLVERLPLVQLPLERAETVVLSKELLEMRDLIKQKRSLNPESVIKLFFVVDDEGAGYDARGKKKEKANKVLVWTFQDFQAHAEEYRLTDWNAGFPAERFETQPDTDE
ncbi:MAG: hypothetical protein COV60_01540 [Candidatus Magasanikbacteria bacterium CG11_big_fil_rev_8_21_14_0_20_43_7]|uniref:Uncharacterized protein n=1 Tax=Candidatus Magasanikbacteria bacterium CG11_big_fil_rev_8_21_14_0_20_43_7 TaxID=1974654 RepID=A0A2H0N2U7_9BACT|nr:MAG: hypothetical protein COV60_01540 [Candidatus Magasanikbacteria bacterium CG11_big_fil_rev_8_21_14_0_20_43_7]